MRDNKLESLGSKRQVVVKRMLRSEFSDFFTQMTTATGPQWPSINDQELVDAIADSLIDMGRRRGKGIALLQTLVYELQDRVNSTVSSNRK